MSFIVLLVGRSSSAFSSLISVFLPSQASLSASRIDTYLDLSRIQTMSLVLPDSSPFIRPRARTLSTHRIHLHTSIPLQTIRLSVTNRYGANLSSLLDHLLPLLAPLHIVYDFQNTCRPMHRSCFKPKTCLCFRDGRGSNPSNSVGIWSTGLGQDSHSTSQVSPNRPRRFDASFESASHLLSEAGESVRPRFSLPSETVARSCGSMGCRMRQSSWSFRLRRRRRKPRKRFRR